MSQATVGELLRRHRVQLGLTQRQVGDQIGYDHSLVSRIERDIHTPTREYLQQFCKSFSLSAAEHKHLLSLLSGTGETQLNALDSSKVDWGTCPIAANFYGRSQQLALLNQWASMQTVNLIGLFGLGGVGKTYLAAKFARTNQSQYDYVFWRTLTSPFPAIDLLSELITNLSDQLLQPPSQNIGQAVHQLKSLLEARRCLIVLDNLESVLDAHQVGKYQAGFKDYGYLIDQVSRSEHRSCFVLTSRYKPDRLSLLEGNISPVRTLYLEGLDVEACQKLLKNKKISATQDEAEQLRLIFSGNALALEIVAETIYEVYRAGVPAFLRGQQLTPTGIEDILQEQFTHLSRIQKEILVWLAIERQPLTIQNLANLISSPAQKPQIAPALQYLKRRSLIEPSAAGFSLQNVVMDYLLTYLTVQICEEIDEEQFDYLDAFPLLSTYAPEFIQSTQRRLLHQRIVNQLALHNDSLMQVERQLRQTLSQLQRNAVTQNHYLAGNVLNLLITLGADINHCALSSLRIHNVDFRNTRLCNVNLANAELIDCIFHETFGHVLKVSFSPDGRFFAAATANGKIHIWETATRHKVQILDVDKNWVRSFDWHPNSKLIVTGSSGQTTPLIQVWDIESGKSLQTMSGHQTRIRSVAYSSDAATIVTGSEDNTVKIWDAESGICRFTLNDRGGAIWAVAIHPDKNIVAAAGVDQSVRLWDASTGALLQTLEGHTDWVTAVTFNVDGTQLATGSKDQTARLWHTGTGQCEAVLRGHEGWVRNIAYTPDKQQLATAGADHTIRLWNLVTRQCIQVMIGHDALIESIVFSPDGQYILSGGADQTIRLWQRQSGHCVYKITGYKNPMWSVKLIQDDTQIVSGSSDGIVRVWDRQTGEQQYVLRGHSDWAKSIAIHPHEKLIASSSSDKTIILWNSQTWQMENRLEGHTSWISSIDFNPDGKLIASGGGDYSVRLWDVNTGNQKALLEGHNGRIWCVRFSPDGRFLASASDDTTIRVWDIGLGRCVSTLTQHTGNVYTLAFSPDGNQLLSGGNDNKLQVWHLAQSKLTHTVPVTLGSIWDIAFHPHKKMFAIALSDHTVKILDSVTYQPQMILQGHKRPVWGIDFSQDGQSIITCSDDETIKVWVIETGHCVKTLSAERPYERLNISGVKGLTLAQKQSLFALGAFEDKN